MLPRGGGPVPTTGATGERHPTLKQVRLLLHSGTGRMRFLGRGLSRGNLHALLSRRASQGSAGAAAAALALVLPDTRL